MANKIKKELFLKIREYYQSEIKNRTTDLIPVSGKSFDENELISIVDAALDCWWTEGRKTKEFEQLFNKYLGIKHTTVVNSGSSANLLAIMTLTSPKLGSRRLIPGDEVITVAAAFPTTINPIIQAGCIPVFCDVEIPSYNISIKDLKKAISPKTKAIILAHTLGNPFDINEVTKLCREKRLWLIEDCCDALGTEYQNKKVGVFGDLATFSFYPAHHITMGEGGALCTNNDQLYSIAKSMRDWGRDCICDTGQNNKCHKRYSWKLGQLPHGYDHKYTYSELGYNLKNTDLTVSIAIAQMKKLPGFIKSRKRNYDYLYQRLQKFSKYFILPEQTPNSNPSWFGFPITIKKEAKFTRQQLLNHLAQDKIDTRLLFAGNILKQPYFIDYQFKYRIVSPLLNTDRIMENTFWIGVSPQLKEEHLKKIISSFQEFIKKNG